MKKLAKVLAGFAALAFVVTPAVPVGAYSEGVTVTDGAVTVSTYADFKDALADASVNTINLGGDIDVPVDTKTGKGQVDITRNVTINGNDDYAVKFDRSTGWKSNFLQVYKSTVTVKNLTVEGGNLAFFVNGGTLNLEGTINISGNFGGIGLSQGGGVTEVPTLNIANGAVLNYTGESVTTPAIYKDEKTAKVSVKYDGIKAGASLTDGSGKVYFYLNAANAPVDEEGYTMLNDEQLNEYRVTPIADEQQPTPETPDVTEPVDEGKDTDADVTAPNTGAVIANASLVVLGIAVAVLTAVYAARFANARK